MPEGSKTPEGPPCVLPPASCSLLPASCFMPPASSCAQQDRHLWGPRPTAHDPPSRFLPHPPITCAKRNTITTTATCSQQVSQSVSQSPGSMWGPPPPPPLLAPSRKRGHIHDHPEKRTAKGAGTTRIPSRPPLDPSVRTCSVGRRRAPRLKLIATPGCRGRRLPDCAFIAHLAS